MNTLTGSSILLAVTLGFPLTALAEKWEGVYTYPEPNNTVVYVDTDSASRKGEIATIYEKVGVSPKTLRTYDCVRDKVLQSWPEKKIADLDEATRPGFEKACKNLWPFW